MNWFSLTIWNQNLETGFMFASSHIFDIDFLDVLALKAYRSGQKKLNSDL